MLSEQDVNAVIWALEKAQMGQHATAVVRVGAAGLLADFAGRLIKELPLFRDEGCALVGQVVMASEVRVEVDAAALEAFLEEQFPMSDVKTIPLGPITLKVLKFKGRFGYRLLRDNKEFAKVLGITSLADAETLGREAAARARGAA